MAEALKHRIWAAPDEDREEGASALEWAIIAAITVVMASVIAAVIYTVVTNKSTEISNCVATPTTACTPS